MQNKYKIGEIVAYRGVIGKIERIGECFDGRVQYHLVSIDDEEITATCTGEDEITSPDNLEDGESERNLADCRFYSGNIMHKVDRITDKYIGDCSFT